MPSKNQYKKVVNFLCELKETCKEWPEVIIAREFNTIKTPSDYNDMKCFGGKSFFSMKPNGNVTPCSYIDDIICGNVTKQSIAEIWNSKKMLDFSKDFCPKTCQYAETCRGGCKAVSYLLENEISCDPYCFVEMLNSKQE
jgi:radical SAM protein with 4Fe4S-binding SPASM domain